MRIGTVPLMMSVAAAAARVLGLDVAADATAIAYLALATALLTRQAGTLAVRA